MKIVTVVKKLIILYFIQEPIIFSFLLHENSCKSATKTKTNGLHSVKLSHQNIANFFRSKQKMSRQHKKQNQQKFPPLPATLPSSVSRGADGAPPAFPRLGSDEETERRRFPMLPRDFAALV